MLQFLMVVTVLVGGQMHQMGPTEVPSMEACVEKGTQVVNATTIETEDGDGIKGIGFTCVKRLVPKSPAEHSKYRPA